MGYTRADALYDPINKAKTVERQPGNKLASKLASSKPVKMYRMPPMPLQRTAGKTIQPKSNHIIDYKLSSKTFYHLMNYICEFYIHMNHVT